MMNNQSRISNLRLPNVYVQFDKNRIFLTFNYNKSLVDAVKKLSSREYDPKNKCWIVPDTTTRRREIKEIFRGIAKIILPKENSDISAEAIPSSFTSYLLRKRYSRSSVKNYTYHLRLFLQFAGSGDPLSEDAITSYFNSLVTGNKASSSFQHMAVNAVKLYVEVVCGKKMPRLSMRPKKEKPLPRVLSKEDVTSLIRVIENRKHRLAVSLIYSAGLRVSEAINLKVDQFDFARSVILIKQSKGRKDRQVPLSKKIIPLLKDYIEEYKPKEYLLEGQKGCKYSVRSIQNVFRNAFKKANIGRHATVHSLRHSFATHLLEKGTDIRIIQEILGHNSSKTTEIYTHVSTRTIGGVTSPIDNLDI